MENFNLNMPTKIYFGKGQISNLGKSISEYGKKVLMVYGKGSIKRNGVYDAVVEELKQYNIDYIELSGVDPNPRLASVVEGANICKKENVDFILAVGGGSSIDCAKGIAVAAKYEKNPWDFFSYKVTPEEALPIACVLTLAATGSEMNCGAVITNEDTKEKWGWGNPLCSPIFSILDPTYTYTVSKHQTACGAVDILSHVYEFYFSNKEAVITDYICEAIMKTVIDFGIVAYNEPDNYEARANLMWASSMALNGIATLGKDFDGFNHIAEHAISGIHDITHADGLSILIPHWMKYILNKDTVKKLAQFGRNVWGIDDVDDWAVANEAIKYTSDFYSQLEMPLKFADIDIDISKFDKIIDKAIFEGTIGNFRKITRQDMKNILISAL